MTLLFAWFCLFLLPENQCPSRRCSRPADDGYRPPRSDGRRARLCRAPQAGGRDSSTRLGWMLN
jgi:hypothetical protein